MPEEHSCPGIFAYSQKGTLESQFLPDDEHVEGSGPGAFADDRGNIADPCLSLAVHAEPRLCAGIGQAESFVVYRCGDHTDPFLSCSEVPDDLVRSQYDDDLSGPEDHCSHTVPIPVPVDQLSVKSHRVRSGKEYVAGELLLPDGYAFLVGEPGRAVIKDRVSLA